MDITDMEFHSRTTHLALASDLIEKGWQPVWCPFWPNGKFSLLQGLTGDAPYMTVLPPPDGACKLGFRVPPNVVVIDVDAYDGKHGDESLERAESWLGELPDTWRITSRGWSNLSGRYLFRKPEDLDFSESALWQFREPGTEFGIEILRTTHRFSWAAGEIHYKTGEVIKCWDPMGTLCDMPYVHELPELPERWVAYLRNPPVPQGLSAYHRPADGPQWWLSQPDASLSTDDELKGFAWDMLLSRVPVEDIWEQWQRVARSADPSWPWERKDFDRHVRTRALGKVDEILAHEDAERDDILALDPDADLKYEKALQEFEKPRELVALITEQPMLPDSGDLERMAQLQPQFTDRAPRETRAVKAEEIVRGHPRYNDLFFQAAAREVLKRDVMELFADEFEGFEDISALPEPEVPAFLNVTGRGCLLPPCTVTVMSGNRASGKTWAVATWAAQELRSGGHVVWIDFERQAHLLSSKLRVLNVPEHLTRNQVHYTGGKLPSTDRLTQCIRQYRAEGNGRVLLVVDAFRGLQGRVSPGTSANDGDAVEAVYLQYLNPAAARDAGATVVVIDHITKTGLGGTFGSERKESAADHVIRVTQQQKFSKESSGYSTLEITKDRYGNHSAGTIAAALWVPVAGQGRRTPELSGKSLEEIRSIKEYPDIPELRSWCPDGDGSLEQFSEDSTAGKGKIAAVEAKLARESAVLAVVGANPLKYGLNALSREVAAAYPAEFDSWEAAKAFIQKMKGKQVVTDSAHRYELAPGFLPEPERQLPQPGDLHHPDGEQVSG